MLIFAIALFIHIPQTAIELFLNLIVSILPSHLACLLPRSFYSLNKLFDLYQQPRSYVKHYCINCIQFYEKNQVSKSIHKFHEKSHLIYYDLNDIYNIKLQNRKFCNDLLSGLSSRNHQLQLNDINSGRISRTMRKYLNLLYPKQNRNAALFVDGVAIYNSSSVSLFPGKLYFMPYSTIVFLLMLDIPVEKRYDVENFIFIGVIASASKPHYT